ncbi:hypothetical protein [Microbacterium sp. NPDC096154]|uniref:hypothetical protein n=1 Tax=Microbacterium sp. NPDC096154 TaxID=3155549 RepID=UPI003322251E
MTEEVKAAFARTADEIGALIDVLRHGRLQPSGIRRADSGTLIVLEYLEDRLSGGLSRRDQRLFPADLDPLHGKRLAELAREIRDFLTHLRVHIEDGRLVPTRAEI